MSAGPPSLPGVTHRYIEARGLMFHVAEAGRGDPLLLVHGWPEHWYCWRELIPELSRHWRVICPDLRGFGWSEAPSGGYEKENLARDVVALLDALDIDRCHYIGHDWGGYIGFLIGLRHPERLRGLIALGITHPWTPRAAGTRHAWRLAAYQLPMDLPLAGSALFAGNPGFLRATFRLGIGDKARFPPEDAEVYIPTLAQPARARAASEVYRSFALRDLRLLLSGHYRSLRLDMPARLLVGDRDPVIQRDMVAGFERRAPQMTLEMLPGVGHFVPEERPEAVLQAVTEVFGPKPAPPTAPARGPRAPARPRPSGGKSAPARARR